MGNTGSSSPASPDFRCYGDDCPPCGIFEGRSGKAVVLTLTALAFLTYLSIFAIRKSSGKDSRSWKVFWLDLMKMGIGQGFAWVINVINSHRNSEMAAGEGESFDAVSWYFPTFMNDELIAVPLGVGLWQLWTRLIRQLAAAGYTSEWIQALAVSGRYHPNQGELTRSQSGRIYLGGKAYDPSRRACGCVGAAWNGCCTPLCNLGGCGDKDPEVKYDWWFVQLFFWVLCVLLSRVVGGLVVPFCHTMLGEASPYYKFAAWIYSLHFDVFGVPAEGICAVKRWTFAGFFRIAIDVLQLAFVDFFNKFKKFVAAKASPVKPALGRRGSSEVARGARMGKTTQLM